MRKCAPTKFGSVKQMKRYGNGTERFSPTDRPPSPIWRLHRQHHHHHPELNACTSEEEEEEENEETNGLLLIEDFDGYGNSRIYNPVLIAALHQHNMPFLLQDGDSYSLAMRKRSSLVEAFNNTIPVYFPLSLTNNTANTNTNTTIKTKNHYDQHSIKMHNCHPSTTMIHSAPTTPHHRINQNLHRSGIHLNTENVAIDDDDERIYSIRQVLQKVSEELRLPTIDDDHLDQGQEDNNDGLLDTMRFLSRGRTPRGHNNNLHNQQIEILPPRLMRSKPSIVNGSSHSHGRRSRSQPQHSPQHIDSDEQQQHQLSRTIDSDCSSKPTSYRSSVHSTSSSLTTSSSENNDQPGLLAEAAWDHVAMLGDELPFAAGDVIRILDCSSHAELWFGSCHERTGWFPSSHVRVLTRYQIDSSSSSSSPLDQNISLQSNQPKDFPQPMRYLRAKIIQELMSTERDYVGLLLNLVEGFLEQTRRRAELFPPERVLAIFGNLESIRALHCKLLRELELAFNEKMPENSCVGTCFLRNQGSFAIYAEYCNNRSISCAELALLVQQQQYFHFFEACRLLRGMPRLSLEGFLLTPVQRICRYPLQLAELLKATPESHPDRDAVEAAERAMRSVAGEINDRKRRLESLQKIVKWQRMVDGWRGPDLLEANIQLLHSGEMTCRCQFGGSQWTKDVVAFLFDNVLIICKRDLLKRNVHIFKDRVSLAHSNTVVDIRDGRDAVFGVTVKNGWKLQTNSKHYLFNCRDRKSKREWMEALEKRRSMGDPRLATADERRLVALTIRLLANERNNESSPLDSARKSESQFYLPNGFLEDWPGRGRLSARRKTKT